MKRLIILISIIGITLPILLFAQENDSEKIISQSEELLNLGKVEEARALLEKGVVDYPESPALNEKLGALYFEIYVATTKEPKEEDILSYYEKAIELDPDNDATLSRLGYIYYWFGEWDKSEKVCKRAIELNRDNIKAWRSLGLTYCAFRNENEKGEEVYKKMVDLFPDKADGYLRLGVLYGKLNKPTEALSMYLRAVDVQPDNLYTIYLLFNYFNDQEWKEARDYIARIGLNAKSDDILDMKECYYKGIFYQHLEMLDKAKNLYKMVLEKFPRKNAHRKNIEYELKSIELEKEFIEWKKKHLSDFNNQTGVITENPFLKQRREILAHKREEITKIWNDWKQNWDRTKGKLSKTESDFRN